MHTPSAPEPWIERDLRPKFPHLADKAIETQAIAQRACASGELASGDLARLQEFCGDKSSMLRDWAASTVGALSSRFVDAGALLIKLVEAGRADMGVSALAALHRVQDQPLMETVTRLGLVHKSKKVRELAACKIQGFRLHAVLPELAEAIGRETDAECRKALRCSYFLLKDGHVVESLEAGALYISVAGPSSIVGQRFDADEIREKGLDALVVGLKASARF